MRMLQYLKFVPVLSKHIDIFIIIVEEILSFMVVFFICIFTFATSFYMLGRNQIQFDEIDDSADTPPHHTFFMSTWSIWHLCLGNPEIDQFFVGNQGQAPYLTAMYVIASFFLSMYLLNMLIAIMGNEFDKNNEIVENLRIQERLRFVLDKFIYGKLPFVFGNGASKYIICAFLVEDEVEASNMVRTLARNNDKMEADFKRF